VKRTKLVRFDALATRLLAADCTHALKATASRHGVRIIDRDAKFTPTHARLVFEAAIIGQGKLASAKSKTRSQRPKPAMYAVTYTVRGSGTFPLDMLRRDAAHPATSEDVNNIIFDPADIVGEVPSRHVCLVTYVKSRSQLKRAINAERWRSFGWSVDQAPAMTAPTLVPR
jgi:hypothetical protein